MERVTATPALLLALLISIAYTVLSSQITSLEAERDSLHSRVELVEQAFTALLTQTSAAAALPARRGLQDTADPNDRATVRVDAPDGISEIILGGEAAADNVVLRKAHERDGAAFTLSRNETQVLRVDPAGNVTVLTDPLQVSGTVKVGGSLEVGGELLLGGVRLSVKCAPSRSWALLSTTLSAAASPPRMISEIPSGASTRTVALSLVAVASCSPRRAGRAAAATEDCARRAVNACSTSSTRLCNESRSASMLAICESRSASRLAIWLLRTVRSAALNATAISSANRRAGVAVTRSIRTASTLVARDQRYVW